MEEEIFEFYSTMTHSSWPIFSLAVSIPMSNDRGTGGAD